MISVREKKIEAGAIVIIRRVHDPFDKMKQE